MVGLKRGTVKLVPHDPEWEELFRSERAKLQEIFREIVIDIQHVGSTVIPTIPAKPIIDIAVLVKSLKDAKKYTENIEAMGYQKKQENRAERLFFTKGPEENRIVYLHIGDGGTDYIKDMVLFRDYMIQNPAEAERYAKMKHELMEKFSEAREKYTAGKDEFVQEILRKAKQSV